MLIADFDVKLKLIILATIALVALLVIGGTLWLRAKHFSRYLVGVAAVMVVLVFILSSLLTIHQ
ncbi:hypothetical protein [Levilactobacillus acidifarinae]|uniref:Uncharacterized protein n=1 Tax=Levilactobacillus acidifarinae DSM 19394 = JCM 15949 TaxID=1423715 RepID=A0A0R1LH51_9LACO|nr:hypothetical protein [Levilactobacillus acidifarinae]KRK95227.1 hypothetical protein FD25_GL001610 [Levilactobacillus acidifarinae DSM 19394]GEO70671.1 hypothetical protein LAC03_25810 [Levilactobacillus acidifarinae]